MRDRLLKVIIITSFLYIFIFILTIFYCNCQNLITSIFNFLTINIKDGENFIFQLWVAQLTFTTILVAFATVLFNIMDIRFYGIRLLEIIKFKTFFWDILFVILVIDILTYIPVAYHILMFTVFSAFITSILSLFFIWRIIDVLSNPEKYENLVKEFYKDNVRRDI